MLRIAMLILAVLPGAQPPPAANCMPGGIVRYEPRTFLGYTCEHDCERHKAGFHWAERNAVADPLRCGSLEGPEAEGCRAFSDSRLTPEQAGFRWATENEIEAACLCDGAGARFRVGCRRALAMPFEAPR